MPTPQPTHTVVFAAGQEGYHTFRIPAAIVTARGTLLAFCEGRRGGMSDTGDIDIVLRRSFDGGRTFGPLQVIADAGPDVFGNPCPVIDRDTGRIWLPLTHNLGHDEEHQIMAHTSEGTRTVWLMYSDDDGASWSEPREITATAKREDWTWYATGPGVGIQLRSGRLVIPCDHAVAETMQWRAHVIYSDDHGATWAIGGVTPDKTNECQVAECADGSLILNMRAYREQGCRAIVRSEDGGLTWGEMWDDEALIEPVCQASLLRTGDLGGLLVFSNPASRTEREKMTVRLSEDDGKTWPFAREIYAGPAAYSCLAELADGTLGCLYERGVEHAYEELAWARFDVGWVKEADR